MQSAQHGLGLTWGSVHGYYFSNIEQMVLTWALLFVPVMCVSGENQWVRGSFVLTNRSVFSIHRGERDWIEGGNQRPGLRSKDLRLNTSAEKVRKETPFIYLKVSSITVIPPAPAAIVLHTCYVHNNTMVGSSQISSANRKSANLRTYQIL